MERANVISVYDRLIANHAGLARKGKTTAYTAMNGNMFSFVGPDGELCIRLSKGHIEAYGQSHSAEPVIRYNSVMRGYVAVSKDLLADEDELQMWFSRSVAHAETLKPK